MVIYAFEHSVVPMHIFCLVGESSWEETPLTSAMRRGGICVLDGIHRLAAGTLSALVVIIQDREASLPDGIRFVSHKRWQSMTDELEIDAATLSASNGFECSA